MYIYTQLSCSGLYAALLSLYVNGILHILIPHLCRMSKRMDERAGWVLARYRARLLSDKLMTGFFERRELKLYLRHRR